MKWIRSPHTKATHEKELQSPMVYWNAQTGFKFLARRLENSATLAPDQLLLLRRWIYEVTKHFSRCRGVICAWAQAAGGWTSRANFECVNHKNLLWPKVGCACMQKVFFYLVINVRGRAGSDSSSRTRRRWYMHTHWYYALRASDDAFGSIIMLLRARGWPGGARKDFFSFSLLPPAAVAWPELFLSRPGSSARQLRKILRTRWYTFRRGSSSSREKERAQCRRRFEETLLELPPRAESFSLFVGKIILPRQE